MSVPSFRDWAEDLLAGMDAQIEAAKDRDELFFLLHVRKELTRLLARPQKVAG